METHALNQFQGNTITFEEMRQRIGMRADNVDETRLFVNMVKIPEQVQVLQAKAAASPTGSANSPGQDAKPKDNSGTVKNTMQPKNQHGTGSAHIKEMTETADPTITMKNIDLYKKNFSIVYKRYSTMLNDVCERNAKAATILPLGRDGIIKTLKEYTMDEAQLGIKKALKDSKQKDVSLKKLTLVLINDEIDRVTKGLFKDLKRRLENAESRHEKEAVFDALEYRLRFLAEHIVAKSYTYAYAKTCEQLGIKKVYVDFGKSDDKKSRESIIDTSNFALEDIPPFHAYCTCNLAINK
jgi:hypothetical protein